jgi:hypothetical protein
LENESYEIINQRLASVLNQFEEDLAAGAIISVSGLRFAIAISELGNCPYNFSRV